MYAAASSHPAGISLTILILFLAFLFGLGWLLVRLVSNARKDGSGAFSGCLLAVGFGALTLVLAGIAFACAVTVVALSVGPETLHQYERHWGIGHSHGSGQARSARDSEIENTAEHAEHAEDDADDADAESADAAAQLHADLGDALQEARSAYAEALRSAHAAGTEVHDELRAALRDAATALREAREAAQDARREAARALAKAGAETEDTHGESVTEGRDSATPALQLRFDVRGEPGPQLAQLVERLSGESARLSIVRAKPGTNETQWVFGIARRSPQDVSRLEDELRTALAAASFSDGSHVEFRDVVLQDGQRHDEH
jgi:hypothetical protein